MVFFVDFLGGLTGGGLAAGLLALAAWKYKSLISHWLLKDIEKIKAAHQRELEEAKAGYARELEAYRTSLIAEAEATKANQDVRKTMAIHMANKRFQVIEKLQGITEGLGIRLSTAYEYNHAHGDAWHSQRVEELTSSARELESLCRSARPFLGPGKTAQVLELHNAVLDGLLDMARRGRENPPMDQVSALAKKLNEIQRRVDGIVVNEMIAMFNMAGISREE